jgi:serine/threonine protein kinase
MSAASPYTTIVATPNLRKRGQVLGGKWTLGRMVGRGGTASVYEGSGLNGEAVAIKVLYPHLAQDPSFVERFRLEVELLGRLQHPAFVKPIDQGRSPEGLPFLVMELLDGATIGEGPDSENPKSLEEVVFIVRSVLEALAEMHSLGAVHRDIKPSNLHLTSDGRVKVIDLGIARSEGAEVTMAGTAIGTPGFMAPEQALSKKGDIGPPTDIFAVGATAIVLLNGSPVRFGIEILEAATCAFPTCSDLGLGGDSEVLAVFDRAVRYASAERFQSAREMADALDSATQAWNSEFDGDTTLITNESFLGDHSDFRLAAVPVSVPPHGPPLQASPPRLQAPPALPRVAGAAPMTRLASMKSPRVGRQAPNPDVEPPPLPPLPPVATIEAEQKAQFGIVDGSERQPAVASRTLPRRSADDLIGFHDGLMWETHSRLMVQRSTALPGPMFSLAFGLLRILESAAASLRMWLASR